MLDAFDTGHPNSPYISKLKAIDPKPLSPTSLIDTLVDSATMHIPHGMFRYRGLEWALLQTLTRFPRWGSCTVKVSCDERFQRTAFYWRGHPMAGTLVLSIRHQLQCSRGNAVRAGISEVHTTEHPSLMRT